MPEPLENFIGEIAKSISERTFIKLSLGNYKGSDESLQKLLIRPVTTKKGERLYFLYRHETNDVAKNFDAKEGIERVREALRHGFRTGHLFTTVNDFQLTMSKSGSSRINSGKPTITERSDAAHDKAKKSQIDPGSFYLKALGVTDDAGRVLKSSQDKWRQINRFVEILASLVDKSRLAGQKSLRVVDMGSGSGYLTFAVYDYFRNVREVEVEVTGVEARASLVAKCRGIAAVSDFDGLTFAEGSIADADVPGVDILIALHTCDTATDDALYKGVAAKAKLIIAAPCCHQELRPQMKSPEMFCNVLKHGVMMERTAETVTDGLRSLLLERSGYATKLFEFIQTEHTSKNNMLVATRLEKPSPPGPFQNQIDTIKSLFAITHQRLETLLIEDGSHVTRGEAKPPPSEDIHAIES
ncbi:MAG: SAM-dependent methyltransferase [Blastocatellia bacterium]|nr:SAM-dependent methyltransferase [Blastocatellia bacterium]